jgi:hypothetical protein
VNKRCCEVAARQGFRTVHIRIREQGSIHKDIDRWAVALSTHQAWRHVREVVVELQPMDDPDQVDEEALLEIGLSTPEKKQAHTRACRPLAEPIAKLLGLRDLTWDYPLQVPRTILVSLEQNPRVRLNVPMFSPRSLIRPRDQPQQVDCDELALATSPSLYSISVEYSSGNTLRHVNHNKEAILQLVAGLSPNLRHVEMVHRALDLEGAEWDRERDRHWLLPVPPWEGLVPTEAYESVRRHGLLTKLSLGGHVHLRELQIWRQQTQFSLLQSLTIAVTLEVGAAVMLWTWRTAANSLKIYC